MKRNNGFTIIELLIATMVFSTILLLLSAGLIQVTRLYYKGITTTRTQQTARLIMDNVSRGIQFSGGQILNSPPSCPTGATNPCFFCVNNDRYTYQINKQLVDGPTSGDQQNHVFVKDSSGGCGGPANLAAPPAGSTELMGNNMRLVYFSLTNPSANLYSVSLRVISGDSDLLCSPSAGDCSSTSTSTNLTNNDISCKGAQSGNQFCATSELQSTVQKRI